MPVDKIEAIVDAIAHLRGSNTTPDGDLYQLRNPLGLTSFALPGKHEIDNDGRRIFSSWMAGYRAAVFDCKLKCSGESRAHLTSDDKLENLLNVYGINQKPGQDKVVNYLRRALKDESISRTTPLSWFVTEESK